MQKQGQKAEEFVLNLKKQQSVSAAQKQASGSSDSSKFLNDIEHSYAQ
jgi:hypothetical protein